MILSSTIRAGGKKSSADSSHLALDQPSCHENPWSWWSSLVSFASGVGNSVGLGTSGAKEGSGTGILGSWGVHYVVLDTNTQSLLPFTCTRRCERICPIASEPCKRLRRRRAKGARCLSGFTGYDRPVVPSPVRLESRHLVQLAPSAKPPANHAPPCSPPT